MTNTFIKKRSKNWKRAYLKELDRTNTSKGKLKCPCREFRMEWTMKDERAFQLGEKSGIKQGYAKALDDVEKFIKEHTYQRLEGNIIRIFPFEWKDFKKQEIAKLSHNCYSVNRITSSGQTVKGANHTSPTHIPKESKK